MAADRALRHLETDPDNLRVLIYLASIQIQLDRQSDARSIVESLQPEEITGPDSMFALAEIYELLGQRDNALLWIERALSAGFPLDVIEDYAAFDDLRSDPRSLRLAESSAERPADKSTTDSERGED